MNTISLATETNNKLKKAKLENDVIPRGGHHFSSPIGDVIGAHYKYAIIHYVRLRWTPKTRQLAKVEPCP